MNGAGSSHDWVSHDETTARAPAFLREQSDSRLKTAATACSLPGRLEGARDWVRAPLGEEKGYAKYLGVLGFGDGGVQRQ
jgi:hypothetical protein